MSMCDQLNRVLRRDLDSLRDQVNAYSNEEDVWKLVPGIANSGGTLALHLAGNLQHFIGGVLGGTGYVRDRDAEFRVRGLSRSELLEHIDAARSAVAAGMAGLTDEALFDPYPAEIGGGAPSVGLVLVHLTTHLAYHLGQLDYHRRMSTGGPAVEGMASVRTLMADQG